MDEAIRNGIEIAEVFAVVDDSDTWARCEAADVALTAVTPEVIESLAGSMNPRGPVSVISIPAPPTLERRDTIVLWDIADPGNAGTIIRSAAAFGLQVAATEATVDLWSPKVLRAGVGGHFRNPPVLGLAADPRLLTAAGLRLIAAVGAEGESPEEAIAGPEPVAIVVGNEAHGLPDEVVATSGATAVSLPMPGGAESLNVAVAASILMYLRMTG